MQCLRASLSGHTASSLFTACACVPRMSVITAVVSMPVICIRLSSPPPLSSLHSHRYVLPSCSSDVHPTLNAAEWHLLFYTLSLFFFQMEGKAKKKKESRRHAVYPVPSTKYGYAFEAPLKCKETQAACSLRRLNRASFICACMKRAKHSVNAAFAFVFFLSSFFRLIEKHNGAQMAYVE